MTYRCDNCGSTDTYVRKYDFNFEKNGFEIKINSDGRFCKKCECSVYDRYLDNEMLKKAIYLYNKEYGISDDIKKIRNEIGLSLDELSNIIGCAKKTLISYEKGESIPNDTYMIIIKTILDNPETIKLFSKNLFLNKETEASNYNGYTETNLDKLINIISILSEKGMNKTKLIKELFYIDFLSSKFPVCGMTGLEYSKLPYGPVLDDFETIFESLCLNNIIKYEKKYKGDYEEHIITNNTDIDYSIFRKDELDIINKVKEYFKDYKVKDIVDYSHKEKAFIETNMFDKISYDYAFDLSIDM